MQFAVSADPEAVITTVLGSCVSCCLWDEAAGAGDMNHPLLAGERVGSGSGYGVAGLADMDCLIDEIFKLGGRRDHLKAKIFGGAKMLENPMAIGERNARFALEFLKQEAIPCVNSSVGAQAARAFRFRPATGRVSLRCVTQTPEDENTAIVMPPRGNALELF